MLFFEKSYPEPVCLNIQKNKSSGDYKCGDVLIRLQEDFKNKCYICEWAEPISINVEHFIPHKGDLDLKFSWKNLFFCCSRCNNIKLARYKNLLDCTNPEDDVENAIRYHFDTFAEDKVTITAIQKTEKAKITTELLKKIFDGHTNLKELEAANLLKALQKEMLDFINRLYEYELGDNQDEEQEYHLIKIRRHLSKRSSFASFKRWYIRHNEALFQRFGQYFEP